MTRDQQVREALRVIEPAQDDRARVADDIEDALNIIAVGCSNAEAAKPLTGQDRKMLKQLLATLERSKKIAENLAKHDDEWSYPLALCEDIAHCKRRLSKKTHRTAYRHRYAVQEARDIVPKYCGWEEARVTRGNKWHRLSAVLAGDPKLDLLYAMRKEEA